MSRRAKFYWLIKILSNQIQRKYRLLFAVCCGENKLHISLVWRNFFVDFFFVNQLHFKIFLPMTELYLK